MSGASGEPRDVRLDRVLDHIQDGSQKLRSEGLKDLKSSFDKKSRSVNIDILSDKAYHKIYEVLFRTALSEKQSFLQAKKTTKSAALTRLTTCSAVVRVVIKAGAAKLKSKTVEAVVDHLTQTLPNADGEYCAPITHDYLQALASIVEHEANVERMNSGRWVDVVDFSMQGIAKYVASSNDEASELSSSFSGINFSGNRHTYNQAGSISRHNVELLLRTLLSLVSVPNAPVLEKAQDICPLVLQFLKAESSTVGQAHQLAFSILNKVLASVRADYTSFVRVISASVVPIMTRLWQGKALAKDELLNTVRDEMLITLFTIHLYLQQGAKETSTPDLVSNLEELSEVLRSDYSRRLDRDRMHLDDIDMTDLGDDSTMMPFQVHVFSLRVHRPLAERSWAHLQAIALLEHLLDICGLREGTSDDEHLMDEHPRKRQRIIKRSEKIFKALMSLDENTRLAGLQIIPFVLQECELSSPILAELVAQLVNCLTDKRGNILSWALLALASCCFQKDIHELRVDWVHLWHLGAKALTFSGSCRAAASQLHALFVKGLVQYRQVVEDINAIINTANITGPVILCDSTALFMMHILHIKISESPGTSQTSCNQVIRWFFARWHIVDKSIVSQQTNIIQPYRMLALLRTSFGLPRLPRLTHMNLPGGPLSQAWELHLANQDMIKYLLLIDSEARDATTRACSTCPRFSDGEEITYTLDNAHFNATRKLVSELLLPKLSGTLQYWKDARHDRSSQLSAEIYRAGLYMCVSVLLLLPHFGGRKIPQYHVFESKVGSLIDELLKSWGDSEEKDLKDTQTITETLLQSLQPYLPAVGATELTHLSQECPNLLQFFVSVSNALTQRRLSLTLLAPDLGHDSMDVDDEFTTQRSHTALDPQQTLVPRHDLALRMSPASFYLGASGRLLLIQTMSEAPECAGLVPSGFIDQFLELRDEEIIASRGILHEIFESDLVFDGKDAARLLEHVGGVLSSLEFERCETALGICVDVLFGLENLWSTPDGSSVAEAALQLYQWYINVALQRSIASPTTQKGIAKLLILLLQTEPEYGLPLGIPSPRTSLLGMLQDGNMPVKFYIGNRLSEIFELFTLKKHDSIFVDVLQSLPSNSELVEGIAFRMFVLAKLASRWSTLLRRCIYHIFEVPANVPDSTNHAAKCMIEISTVLGLSGPKELFVIFEPQLLYTWLETNSIENIPYKIFGFIELTDLLSCAKEEATALMIMRGQDESMQRLAQHLRMPEDELLKGSFTKALAYAIGHDLSVRGPDKENGGEKRIRVSLGREQFFECVNLHFVHIIATLFCLVDSEDNVDKRFTKDDHTIYAADIIRTIKNMACSEMTLPPNQQPTFNAKYFILEIEHLCSRTEHKMGSLYTPSLVTFVARRLLSTIHPALGSLHACSILRKIRLLISLAGNTAVTGYPLEMLLHAVRPFIADPDCTDDAIGIAQYLLSFGKTHLQKSPSFVASISLSILGSLRVFLSSSQTQYKSTLSKAQKFHTWVGKYVADFDTTAFRGDSGSNFHKMLKSAHTIGSLGKATLNTAEGELLFQLLEDEQSSAALLDPESRKLALIMLCSNFECPQSFRQDIFESDTIAIEHTSAVWRSCKGTTVSKQYLAWAAKVVGRAFAASGHIQQELLQESNLKLIPQSPLPLESDVRSKATVLNLIQALTLGDDRKAIGLAEAALRFIVSTADDQLTVICEQTLRHQIATAALWTPYQVPPSDFLSNSDSVEPIGDPWSPDAILHPSWLRDLTLLISKSFPGDPILRALQPILLFVPGFAEAVYAFVLHIVLLVDLEGQQYLRKKLSTAFNNWLSKDDPDKDKLKTLVNAILYLRTQPLPHEHSTADRAYWLEVDYSKASAAATRCGMYKTALLFIEEFSTTPTRKPQSSRRSSSMRDGGARVPEPTSALLAIFENIDDPDMYYGVQQNAGLSTVLARLEHERDGPRSLAFRGAQYDSHIRRRTSEAAHDAQALVKTLDVLSLDGLSRSLFQNQQTEGVSATDNDYMFHTARKLEQWDIPAPADSTNNYATLYKTFQSVYTANDRAKFAQVLNDGLECTMRRLVHLDLSANALHNSLQTLAALTELDEVFETSSSDHFEEIRDIFQRRSGWMKTGRFEDVRQILSCRGTALSIVSQQPRLQGLLNLRPIDARLVEVQTLLLSSELSRAQNNLLESLSIATSLMDLIIPCREAGFNAEVVIHVEAANALWDQGEMASSIGMLKALDLNADLRHQTIPVGRSDLLSKIAHQVSVARLEKPDRILDKYLKPALRELKGTTQGSEAGEVFHQFARFCDEQLQDPDGLEDLQRLENLSHMKATEVKELEKLKHGAATPTEKNRYAQHLQRAKTWLRLDEQELKRHTTTRDEFLIQSLENYLLALSASDDHNTDCLRFSALWLEHSDQLLTNKAVSEHLDKVPSRKFASLMNQLASRLLDNNTDFQKLLFTLVHKICNDHPYHGMYQIFAGINGRASEQDDVAMSRKRATDKVADVLKKSNSAGPTWQRILAINKHYVTLALEKNDKYKAGRKISFRDSSAASRLNSALAKYPIPPSTMQIPLAADVDYSLIPRMISYESQMSIASGVSAPKIITAIGSNGQKFRQLVKGGNDDLRQDAIMEQVFAEVSQLLQNNRSTRQRNLSIRTYKVLPLTYAAGVIEFVPNTVPLHDYLMPAHERYYPNDIKSLQCRKEISEVQSSSLEAKVKRFRSVAERFRPVMHFYFTEKFDDPDEWFVKRLAYTRSTAANSVLGHVLGLGDRHGHNILLDSGSGEVVHIDLGIAFEMGRVLPVPELVPFRLTRDIVDGMGITKTEGVFRRSCEFTLEALRKEVYSIMTILDVLRYDPLYSWSISPVRLAKMQEAQSVAPEVAPNAPPEMVASREKAVNQPSEADRALTVVNKKLSKTLSVTATVNDLINQASDERNLAALYSGWAAYA